jgi:hypothetical protein
METKNEIIEEQEGGFYREMGVRKEEGWLLTVFF